MRTTPTGTAGCHWQRFKLAPVAGPHKPVNTNMFEDVASEWGSSYPSFGVYVRVKCSSSIVKADGDFLADLFNPIAHLTWVECYTFFALGIMRSRFFQFLRTAPIHSLKQGKTRFLAVTTSFV